MADKAPPCELSEGCIAESYTCGTLASGDFQLPKSCIPCHRRITPTTGVTPIDEAVTRIKNLAAAVKEFLTCGYPDAYGNITFESTDVDDLRDALDDYEAEPDDNDWTMGADI